jgi:hypothetical protein
MYADEEHGQIVLSPMEGAHMIDIDKLRKIIDLIFKIKIPTKKVD